MIAGIAGKLLQQFYSNKK